MPNNKRTPFNDETTTRKPSITKMKITFLRSLHQTRPTTIASKRSSPKLLTTHCIRCTAIMKFPAIKISSTLRSNPKNSSPLTSKTIYDLNFVVVLTGEMLAFEINEDSILIPIGDVGLHIFVLDTIKEILPYANH